MMRRAGILSAALLLPLAACGDDSSEEKSDAAKGDSASSESVDAASGPTIEGTGYSYSVPEGWDVPPNADTSIADSMAADLEDSDGFADNVNVAISPAGAITPEQVEDQGVKELESIGAEDVTVGDRIEVDGNESAHLSAGMTMNDISYVIDQYYVTKDDQTYVVTFSFSDDVADADREEVAESTLATWTWTD